MEIKILQVFLGADGLPYKDQARTVHYPIAGSGFQGANNSTQIKFYFSELGDSNVTWVAVSKIPNGKIGSKVLETYDDADLGEPYALLELDSFYTQYRGDVYISLQGYEGGVNVSYNAETELYEISGTPTIQATGSIKFSNNYATQFVGSGEEENADIQALMAALGLKANASDTYTRYTSAFSSVTLQTLYNQFGYKAFLLNTGSTYSIDYLMQFQISSGNTHAIRMIRLTDLRTWYAQIGSGSGQLPLSSYVSALFTDTYLKHITTEEYVDTNLFTMASSEQTLTSDEYDFITQNNVRIKYGELMYEHCAIDGDGDHVWVCALAPIVTSNDTTITFSIIVLNHSTQKLTYNSNALSIYSKSQTDAKFVNLNDNQTISGVKTFSSKIVAQEIDIVNNYYQIGLVSDDLVIGTGTGDIYLQPDGKLYYGSYEVADKNFTANSYVARTQQAGSVVLYGNRHGTETIYVLSPNVMWKDYVPQRTTGGHILVPNSPTENNYATNKKYVDDAIASAISTVYKFQGTKTVAQLNALTGQATGDVYNVSDSGTLTQGSVSVVAGDNVVWTGSVWDKLAGEIDLSGYYNKTEVNTLLNAKADISTTVIDSDVIVSGGYITEIIKGGANYPIAQNVDLTTIPKVVQSTTDLPASNDGYLYLVLDNGYLYSWQNGAWTQAYQYTSDLLTITEVTVEED